MANIVHRFLNILEIKQYMLLLAAKTISIFMAFYKTKAFVILILLKRKAMIAIIINTVNQILYNMIFKFLYPYISVKVKVEWKPRP
jgi:hypothetical protein